MARAVISGVERLAALEPLYDIDPRTGTSIEVFYADQVLAQSFGASGPGWFWWTCQVGCPPDGLPTGPFGTSYGAYRDATYPQKFLNAVLSYRPILSTRIVIADTVRTRGFYKADRS